MDAQFGLTLRLHGKKVPRIEVVWTGGIGVVAWQAATSVWASGASGSSPGRLRPLFGFWGWTLWPGKLRLLFGFWGNRLRFGLASHNFFLGQLWPDGNRTTWPVVLPLSWLQRGKQSAKLFA
ncbi:hypothetical protein B0H14DRAFT_2571340 [Mycena olivaceomarginata]|nr:hypothetical protein B0H14DRAFT_2571340 [Mycena olivaceomarginata]